ncbi:predicted nucleic acid-binding protein, contains PIN domain [Anaerolinea thermolimosa]|uniref:type II toxin-antitoxin system VapC family toxin n=1 Tax=Anaerolinea thermolimosa TaxID=229919 RepID=UPI0007855A18|nr:type II toxin-antitoxin system VapC family toxin [Anaerolinea thermolimosa]GAP06129.1 predicted nucleic acid-binding protein, contains PIN domain [Anaerolinea thermolimosa]
MTYLLDTCVISEFTRRQPNEQVVRWLSETDEDTLYLSVLSIGEIRHGIERLDESPRKEALRYWLENDLILRFDRRILPLDIRILLIWGELVGRLERQGRKVPAVDGLIAATALAHDLVIVTRNTADFTPAGVRLLNPWEEG